LSIAAGSRIGGYEVIAAIGAGGMGEVYRARDTRLNRDVALKILPEAFATDPERLARFEREAQVLASLNHPHIAAIHGLEESDGVRALVLEFVDGDTLADRIARGPIALDEALLIARQIAEALDAAHEQGIIHRDLKPANIKVRDDGTVKVLDFGLAKLAGPPKGGHYVSPDRSVRLQPDLSPTITSPALMTGVGVLLGTAAYMSPEQAKGREADKRTDIWAFGCVLYEMLTGTRAFGGDDVTETLAAIIKSEPDWSRLPPGTPESIRRLLRRSLEKDRRGRLADIADARLDLVDAASPAATREPAAQGSARTLAMSARIAWGLFALAVAAVVAVSYFQWSAVPPARQRIRFTIAPPDGWTVALDVGGGGAANLPIAVSPDGNQLAMVARNAEGRQRLWVRSLEALAARELPGTDGAVAPFWSPDSRFVAFFADGKLKKIDVGGGAPVTLCSIASFNSGTWSTQGVIVFSRAGGGASGGGALLKVPQSGGVPTAATTLGDDEALHIRPSFLPDGRHFLYRVTGPSTVAGRMYVGSLDSNDRVMLPDPIGNASYSRGHLLFVRESTLMAQPFDVQRLALTGEPVPVADQIQTSITSVPVGAFSASENGVLAYQTGTSAEYGVQLTWLDRAGKAVGIVAGRARYNDIELSPDGRQAAVSIPRPEQRRDVWLIDMARGVPTRFTFDEAGAQTAVWSPDGTRVIFNALRSGLSDLFEKSAGGGPEQVLLTGEGFKVPFSWSSDGRFVLYSPRTPAMDLWVLPMAGDRKPFPLFQTASRNERQSTAAQGNRESFVRNYGRFSPDGRWVAYVSNESGAQQVYVVPFPDANNGKWQVSPSGGSQPRWRRDGREIFYINDDVLMAATVSAAGAGLQIGAAQPLFKFRNAGLNRSNYDVAADGQRFLFETRVDDASSPPITVVVNWDRK
jgi:Tol biopolymer transport system component